jgi:ABC-type uncharacterized transport system YnjBCD ATPase subunit
MRSRLEAIGACVGGAALLDDLQSMLVEAGFTRVDVALREDSRALIGQWTDEPTAGEFVVSALITAYKTAA